MIKLKNIIRLNEEDNKKRISFFIKNKIKTRLFLLRLRKEFSESVEMQKLIRHYLRGNSLSSSEVKFIKSQLSDILFGVGLGAFNLLPIPGTMIITLFFVKLAKKFNLEIIPSSFRK